MRHPATRLAIAPLLLCAAVAVRAADAPAPARYVLDPAKSTLEFTFTQAGAQNKGRFRHFQTQFDFAPDNLAASRLEVSIEVASLDTGDEERDATLRDAELFAAQKFPQARFSASQIVKTASGYEAVGKLTIRDVSREIHLPFTFRTATEAGASVGYMSGKTQLRRLDYGVGQGDWKATDQVPNEVGVAFALRLRSAVR
ncbi:MAG TPA: YceI family protein [Steroidobacteraceae bacterium]|nr:YceI family protein [Steroidobacteraceae bacterium]